MGMHAGDLDQPRRPSLLDRAQIAGLASAGAGAIHLAAAGSHGEHPAVARIFVVLGAVQLVAGLVLALSARRAAAVVVVVVGIAAVGGWVADPHDGDLVDRRPAGVRVATVRRHRVRRPRRHRHRPRCGRGDPRRSPRAAHRARPARLPRRRRERRGDAHGHHPRPLARHRGRGRGARPRHRGRRRGRRGRGRHRRRRDRRPHPRRGQRPGRARPRDDRPGGVAAPVGPDRADRLLRRA